MSYTWFDVAAQVIQGVDGVVVTLLIPVIRVEVRPTWIPHYTCEQIVECTAFTLHVCTAVVERATTKNSLFSVKYLDSWLCQMAANNLCVSLKFKMTTAAILNSTDSNKFASVIFWDEVTCLPWNLAQASLIFLEMRLVFIFNMPVAV